MSLLERLQAKTEYQQAEAAQAESQEAASDAKPEKKDMASALRRIRGGEQPQKEAREQINKHHELKNRLYKQIFNELNEDNVEEIISKLDAMAVEIMKEDESFRGKVDRKKVIDELANDLTGF
jgi:pilus assembly protein CpaF